MEGIGNMLNTDVFKFEFVDRDDERNAIDSFLNDCTVNSNYSLWLHGKRGTGKSYLLTEYVIQNKQFTSVYVNVDINNALPGLYLKSLIMQLNKSADLKFVSYLRANYKLIATIGKKAVDKLLSIVDLDDIGLDELTSTITNYYTTKYGENDSTVSVVKKYILEALKKCTSIVFLLDNFTQCDSISLEVITQIIHEFQGYTDIKFIICTTDDDLEDRGDIKTILAERIPNKQLLVTPFRQKQLFVRMLERNFDLDEVNIRLLSKAFELCQGYPQRLKEMLINLYTTQGILIDGNKAQFTVDVFRQMLMKDEISFDIDALCRERKGAKIILQIIGLWGVPIMSTVLFEFVEFLADVDPTPILKEEVSQTIQTLEDMHILSRSYEDRKVMLQFKHDSLKIAVSEYFRNDSAIPFLHFSIYEYLMIQQEEQNCAYWCRYYKPLCAHHSYASQADGWIDINYSYGRSFYDSELYYEAELVFCRLESVITSLTGEELLTIGMTFFKCGHYGKANDILTNIQSRNLMKEFSQEQTTMLYIYSARVNSCLLNSQQALRDIIQAEQISSNNTELSIATLGAKQSILYLTPGKFLEAEDLFNILIAKQIESREMAQIYQSAMDYYEGELSLSYLKKGLELATRFSDKITEGRILNNIGFEHLRCGEYVESQRFFLDSISILKEQQPDKQTYPYSNLAVLNMISGHWGDALGYIVEALFWNRSNYASLVLKVNRMLCYFFMNNQRWKECYSELYGFINSAPIVDDKIYKKICINLALIASKSDRHKEGIEILEYCHEYLKNERSHGKYRFTKLYNNLTRKSIKLFPPSEQNYQKYYCEIEFEPWLINFSPE